MHLVSKKLKMKVFYLLLLVVAPLVSSQETVFVCPPKEDIAPCRCQYGGPFPGHLPEPLWIRCDGANLGENAITQETVDRTFRILREVNNLTATDWLLLDDFQYLRTKMTEFDLTPLLYTEIRTLLIDGGNKMNVLSGPNVTTHAGLLRINSLDIRYTNMNDSVFGETLRYFDGPSVEYLSVGFHDLKGSEGNGEFLPGFSNFINVRWLYLAFLDVEVIKGGQFRANNKLEMIQFGSNPIQEVGADAFLFDPLPEGESPPKDLIIYLYRGYDGDNLTDAGISPNAGFDRIPRDRVDLNLDYMQLGSLPAEVFKAFLDKPGNYLSVGGNPIVCDPRVKWLKDRREELEPKVFAAWCVNDPWQTVFTSSLVDG